MEIENHRLIIFITLLLILGVIQIVIPIKKSFLKRPYFIRERINNLLLILLSAGLLKIVFPFGLIGLAYKYESYNWWGLSQLHPVLQTLLIAIVFDLAIYIQHFIMHKSDFFWKFHQVHHSDPCMDVTTGIRFHPGEMIFSGLYKSVLIVLLCPNAFGYIIYEILLSSFSLWGHAHIKIPAKIDSCLRLIFVTPAMHSWHHSPEKLMHTNYGNIFSIWDRIFKAYHSAYINDHFGLKTKNSKDSFLVLLLKPFNSPEN